MGKVGLKNVKDKIDCRLENLQELILVEIGKLFFDNEINNLRIDCREGLGVRGEYENLLNVQLELSYKYFDCFFEFYLSYDQLEYYIFKNNKKVKECNLEDFWKEEIHIIKFISYLKKDLEKLKIPFKKE